MFIDKDTGKIDLPNGLTLTPESNKSEFEGSDCFHQATPFDYGTLPFQWYRLDAGQLDGYTLKILLCFYLEELVIFQAGVNFHPTNPAKWEDWSLEIQSKENLFHEKLLKNILGDPHEIISSGTDYPGLEYNIKYSYKWGKVWSGYDSRAGSSSIVIRYGSRLENAQKHYEKYFQTAHSTFPKNVQQSEHWSMKFLRRLRAFFWR